MNTQLFYFALGTIGANLLLTVFTTKTMEIARTLPGQEATFQPAMDISVSIAPPAPLAEEKKEKREEKTHQFADATYFTPLEDAIAGRNLDKIREILELIIADSNKYYIIGDPEYFDSVINRARAEFKSIEESKKKAKMLTTVNLVLTVPERNPSELHYPEEVLALLEKYQKYQHELKMIRSQKKSLARQNEEIERQERALIKTNNMLCDAILEAYRNEHKNGRLNNRHVPAEVVTEIEKEREEEQAAARAKMPPPPPPAPPQSRLTCILS